MRSSRGGHGAPPLNFHVFWRHRVRAAQPLQLYRPVGVVQVGGRAKGWERARCQPGHPQGVMELFERILRWRYPLAVGGERVAAFRVLRHVPVRLPLRNPN